MIKDIITEIINEQNLPFECEINVDCDTYNEVYIATKDMPTIFLDFNIDISDISEIKEKVNRAILLLKTIHNKTTFKDINNYREADCCDNCIHFHGGYDMGFGVCNLDLLSDDSINGINYCETRVCDLHKRDVKT